MSHGHHASNNGYNSSAYSETISGIGGNNAYNSCHGNNGGQRNYGNGNNSYNHGKSHIYCEFYHYKGHTKETYKLYDYPKKKDGASIYPSC